MKAVAWFVEAEVSRPNAIWTQPPAPFARRARTGGKLGIAAARLRGGGGYGEREGGRETLRGLPGR
jgi:hypothetical protein